MREGSPLGNDRDRAAGIECDSYRLTTSDQVTSDDRRASALYAARRYYVDNATMDSVGRELNASRSTISRLLGYARDSGLVEIHFLPEKRPKGELQRAIEEDYQVIAQIAPASEALSEVDRLVGTAAYGARALYSAIESDKVMAVSWGTMINEVSKRVIEKSVSHCQLVQLNGFGFPTEPGVHYSNSMMTQLSRAYHAYVQDFPVPIFFDRNETKELLFKERTMARIRRLQYNADIALFNVGTVRSGGPDQPYSTGYFIDDADVSRLFQDGAVGEIAGTYFNKQGDSANIDLNRRTSGPDLERLRNVSRRICVTSGDHKIPALNAALAGGYITDLVIDEVTARNLLSEN